MATLTDVARASGVSVTTASRVLNPGSHPVNGQTAARVRAAATELGFRPNRLARGLRSHWVPTVGVLIHDVTDPYFGEIARGVTDTAAADDFLTITCNTYRNPREELRYMALLCDSRVAGVLLVGGGLKDDAYRTEMASIVAEIRGYGGHVVALGPREELWPAEVPDNRGGVRQAVEHLLALGHRRIGLVGGPEAILTTGQRELGYDEALRAAGIEPDPRMIVSGGFTIDGGARAMRELLDGEAHVTAVLAATDAMAVGCLRTLRDRRIGVPEDLSLVGFDNIPVSEYLDPPLTTVDLHMRELGAAGMKRLLALLRGADDDRAAHIHRTDLVIRRSTARVSGGASDAPNSTTEGGPPRGTQS